jgi:hypothetical protein
MLLFQIGLSFALVFAARALGWPATWQAAGPAVALCLSLGLTSVVKVRFLERMLGHAVAPWRWSLLWAALAAIGVGTIFTALPQRFEWTELVIGIPAIAATYLFVLWRWSFGDADRALFRRKASPDVAALPDARAAGA